MSTIIFLESTGKRPLGRPPKYFTKEEKDAARKRDALAYKNRRAAHPENYRPSSSALINLLLQKVSDLEKVISRDNLS